MSEPVAAFHQVTYAYPQGGEATAPAVADLSFSVMPGEWLAIIGHNGSGKSTAAKLLAGLLVADRGTVRLFGQDLNEDTVWTIRSRLGMVFQNPDNQFVGATVEDDVAFSLENRGVAPSAMRPRVSEALVDVGMAEFQSAEPHRLSGGQKQRVAIAGALASQPELLVLDEATSMLDPQGRADVLAIVQRLRRSSGVSVLSITHDLEEAALADRVLVLNGGRLWMEGRPRDVFAAPGLADIGLALPFALTVQRELARLGFPTRPGLTTEEELVDDLCKSHFSK